MVLTVFSAVALCALTAREKADDRESKERWAMAVTCLSLIMGILGTAAYLLVRSIFVGQLPEAVMVSG